MQHFFSKSLRICRKYEDNEDLCGLVLKLFGSPEAKLISSVIPDWAKSKKYETEKSKEKEKENDVNSVPQPYALPTMGFPQPYPPMMYLGPQLQPMASGFGSRMPIIRRGRKHKANVTCFFCKESEHFISKLVKSR